MNPFDPRFGMPYGNSVIVSAEHATLLKSKADMRYCADGQLLMYGIAVTVSPVFPYDEKCAICSGSGAGHESTYCQTCSGTGQVRTEGIACVDRKMIIIRGKVGVRKFEPSFPAVHFPQPKLCRGLI